MGLFDKIKQGSRGVITSVDPADGVDAVAPAELIERLLAIAHGRDRVEAVREPDEDAVVIAWSGQFFTADLVAETRYAHRMIRVTLDDDGHTARGLCMSTDTDVALRQGLRTSWTVQRGQMTGSETSSVVSLSGGDEERVSFSWSDLRDPIIETVTGAGWRYVPAKH